MQAQQTKHMRFRHLHIHCAQAVHPPVEHPLRGGLHILCNADMPRNTKYLQHPCENKTLRYAEFRSTTRPLIFHMLEPLGLCRGTSEYSEWFASVYPRRAPGTSTSPTTTTTTMKQQTKSDFSFEQQTDMNYRVLPKSQTLNPLRE